MRGVNKHFSGIGERNPTPLPHQSKLAVGAARGYAPNASNQITSMAPIADRGLLGWKVDVVGVVDTCPNPSYLSLTGCSSGVVGASLAYHYGQVLGIPAQARHGPSCIFAWHMVVTARVSCPVCGTGSIVSGYCSR